MRRIKLKITLIYPATVITSVCVCVFTLRSLHSHTWRKPDLSVPCLCVWDGSTHSICGECGGREGARIPPLESSLPSAVRLQQQQRRQWRRLAPLESLSWEALWQRRDRVSRTTAGAKTTRETPPRFSSYRLRAHAFKLCVTPLGPQKPNNAPSRFSFQGCENLNNSKWLGFVQVCNILEPLSLTCCIDCRRLFWRAGLSSTKKPTLIWTLWLSKVIPKSNNEGLWVSVRAWSKADYSICQWQHTDFTLDFLSAACYLQTPSGAVRNQRWHSVR